MSGKPGTTLSTVAQQCADKFARRACLVQGERRWTFAEFWRDVEALAAGLAARLPRGERVGCSCPTAPNTCCCSSRWSARGWCGCR